MNASSPQNARFAALKIVCIYALLAALWIYLSDHALSLLVQDRALLVEIAVYKGFLFIVITAAVLYQLIHRYVQAVLLATREVASNQELLNSLIEGSSDAIYAKDTAGRYLIFNDAACRMTGREVKQVLGKDDTALFAPEEAAMVMTGDRKVMAGDRLDTYEEYVTLADGQPHTFLSIKWPIRNEKGEVNGIFGTARDITDLKRVQASLENEQSRLRNLLQTMPAMVWMKDLNGVYLGCNSRFERFFGAREEEVLGKTDYDFVDAALADFFRENDKKAIAADGPTMNEEWVTYADDGHRELLETVKTPVRDSEGRLVGVLGIARDITEHRRAEDALQDERLRFKSLVDSIDGIVWEADATTFTFTYVSQQAERLLGFPVEAWYRPGFWQGQLHPEDREWVSTYCANATFRHEDHDFEYRIIARDGRTVWLHDIVTVVVENDAPRWLRGLMVDTTAMKAVAAEKQKLESQLLQAQKMEAIGRLAGGVAHDFNNKLTVILGFAEIAREKGATSEKYRDYLSQVIKAAAQSRDITQQLLAFSRQELISPRVLDLNTQVRDVQKGMGRFIGEDIRFEINLAPDLWPVNMDPSQVDQLIMNLVVNARDAMADGGLLAIETRNVQIGEAHTLINPAAAPGDYVQLMVSDSGCGMDRETMQHIFEPFYTTKEAGKGTGLGLATLYGIVTQNRGFVNVYSEPGSGTSFKLYLPRSEKPLEEPALVEMEFTPSRSATILLVEDDESVRLMTQEILAEAGYTTLVVATPQDALSIFASPDQPFDLLITDVIMPGMNGRELTRKLAELHPKIPVLFMSGYPADIITQKGVLDTGVHFLQKPFDQHTLLSKIHGLLSLTPGGYQI